MEIKDLRINKELFDQLKGSLVSTTVENANMGVMGAVEVCRYTSPYGVGLESRYSNGGADWMILGSNNCPGHGRAECAMCCWPAKE
jgi:hypothetical protein